MIKNFFKENKKTIIVISLLLYAPGTDIARHIYGDKFYLVLKQVFKEAIAEEIIKVECSYSLKLIELEMKNIRKPEEVDEKVKFWRENNFNAQIASLKIISKSDYALEQLEKIVYNEKVYKALLSHVK